MSDISPKRLSDMLAAWKTTNWPPAHLRQYNEKLPIYFGEHDVVAKFGESLADIMAVMSAHVMDECGGKVPRWMMIPKIYFGVERMNLTSATAKASRQYSCVDDLLRKCGPFAKAELKKMQAWLDTHPDGILVAHKAFEDLRSYVFTKANDKPSRERFYQSGLVMAVEENFVIQDHRDVIRDKRDDAYSNPLGKNARNWEVYGLLDDGRRKRA